MAGYGVRLDFLPHYLRGLLATLVLMPLVSSERLRTRSCESWEPGERMVAILVGVFLIWLVVGIWSFWVPTMPPSVTAELGVLSGLLLLGLWYYRRRLEEHFATADLV